MYRGLKHLQCAGLVRYRKLASGETVYSPLERDQHYLTCVHCDKSEPLPSCPFEHEGPDLSKDLLHGFQPMFHTFEIHGLCRSCQQLEENDDD